MRICIVTEYFPSTSLCEVRGGAEMVAYREAAFLARNHEVEVITSREKDQTQEDQIGNITIHRCGNPRGYVQKGAFMARSLFLWSAYHLAKKRTYDIILGYNILTYPLAWRISQKLHIPCVLRYHDVLIGRWRNLFGFAGWIGEVLERYTLSRYVAAIVAVSSYTAENVKRIVANRQQIFVVHNGVDLPESTSSNTHQPSILCISRLVKYKRVEDVIQAVAMLIPEFPELHCSILGTGPEEKPLKRLSEQLKVEDHLHFIGFVRNYQVVTKHLDSTFVTCFPSSVEGFGIALLESMASGVPFIASDIAPFQEVSQGEGGLFFQCGDVEDLASQLRTVLADTNLRNKLASEARKRAETFSWEVTGREMEAVLTRVVEDWRRHER